MSKSNSLAINVKIQFEINRLKMLKTLWGFKFNINIDNIIKMRLEFNESQSSICYEHSEMAVHLVGVYYSEHEMMR
jgi:hypothetical protein